MQCVHVHVHACNVYMYIAMCTMCMRVHACNVYMYMQRIVIIRVHCNVHMYMYAMCTVCMHVLCACTGVPWEKNDSCIVTTH